MVDDTNDCDKISFAAFHSRQLTTVSLEKPHTSLLPLLRDQVNSPATVRHLMNVITRITYYVSGNQVPVLAADQPVYAIAKNLQWRFPALYGEDKIIIMMGGLHIEMAIQNLIGKWLLDSGWADMFTFTKAEIATSGRC